jgi:acetoacetyl-CoA reductase
LAATLYIDVLVNNAGITRDGMFHKMTFEQWQAVIRTNLDSRRRRT